MPGRILSLQMQARELGRLRTGYTDGRRPVRSDTWIVSSHAEHYVQAAAEFWGGTIEKWQPQGGGAQQWRVRTTVDALDALLPPGDPLSQSLELWSGGGCARRCDGVTEMQSDGPCVCRSQFGDDFHEQAKGTVCAATTRLNVFLPEMPDVGVFRMETHSHYAAQEIAGAVDLIKSATGPESVIPIRLRIEQRQRKAQGQTKKFPVVVVELRGITTGQVLEGSVMGQLPAQRREAIEASGQRAIEAPATDGYVHNPEGPGSYVEHPELIGDQAAMRASLEVIARSGTLDDLRQVWPEVKAAGLVQEAMSIAAEMKQSADPIGSELSADLDGLWLRIMQAVPDDWTSTRVEKEFKDHTGVLAEDAGASEMRAYLDHLAVSA